MGVSKVLDILVIAEDGKSAKRHVREKLLELAGPADYSGNRNNPFADAIDQLIDAMPAVNHYGPPGRLKIEFSVDRHINGWGYIKFGFSVIPESDFALSTKDFEIAEATERIKKGLPPKTKSKA